MLIDVYYMSGAGNLFSVIDNRKYNFNLDIMKNLAPVLCNKNQYNNFISEGLIALNEHIDYDFAVEFINPDGSHGAMCGNGGRCAVKIAQDLNIFTHKHNVRFAMADEIYEARINYNNTISLSFPPPHKIDLNLHLNINNKQIETAFVDIGADHAIINYQDLHLKDSFRQFDINTLGKLVRYDNTFQPRGANANFYNIEKGKIQLRTYERGVEAETGACGTGAIATALICNLRHSINFPITIIPPSREQLTVDAVFENEKIKKIILGGPAETLDNKTIDIPDKFFEVKND